MRLLALLLAALLPLAAAAESAEAYSQKIASLIAPAKLATLGKRGANPRVEKVVAILEDARRAGYAVSLVASNAVVLANYTNQLLATLTFDSLTRNHTIADRLGVFTAGLDDMRRGKSPIVQRGPYEGDLLSVDHIVPVAVAPELDNLIANLELMPRRMNSSKGAKLGARQYDYAKRFRAAGQLSAQRLAAILPR